MKIVFLDTYPANVGDLKWEDLMAVGDLVHFASTPQELVVDRCQGAEIIITNKCMMTDEVMAQLPDLKCICIAATGYDNVDLGAASKLGILVCNVAGYSTSSVVQHVFALLLSTINEPMRYAAGVRAGRWARSSSFAYVDRPIRSLSSMTIGILGYGTIGQAVAKVAVAMGMTVVAYRRTAVPSPIPGVRMVSQNELLRISDVVSLHLPATTHTTDMVDASFLSHLKVDCILINTGRGSLVVEDALAAWLATHPRARALLDVMRQEPPPVSHPLYGLSNCIITPHQAWMGTAARQTLLDGIVSNIKKYVSGTLIGLQ